MPRRNVPGRIALSSARVSEGKEQTGGNNAKANLVEQRRGAGCLELRRYCANAEHRPDRRIDDGADRPVDDAVSGLFRSNRQFCRSRPNRDDLHHRKFSGWRCGDSVETVWLQHNIASDHTARLVKRADREPLPRDRRRRDTSKVRHAEFGYRGRKPCAGTVRNCAAEQFPAAFRGGVADAVNPAAGDPA
jgi:hypothetical protein